MRVGNAHRAVDAHVHLDGDRGADAARAQVVRRADLGVGCDDREDLLLDIRGQRLFEQLAQPRADQVQCDLEDEDRNEQRRDRVGDAPLLAEEVGAADAGEGAQRREGVAAVVPGVGYDARTVDPAADAHRVAVENLLGDDRDDGRHEGDGTRTGQRAALEDRADGADARREDADADRREGEADDDRGEGLVLAVAVVVPVVLGFGRDAGEDDHDDVGRHVREGVDGVGDHGAASAENAGGEFGRREDEIDDEPDEGDAVNLLFACGCVDCHAGLFFVLPIGGRLPRPYAGRDCGGPPMKRVPGRSPGNSVVCPRGGGDQ